MLRFVVLKCCSEEPENLFLCSSDFVMPWCNKHSREMYLFFDTWSYPHVVMSYFSLFIHGHRVSSLALRIAILVNVGMLISAIDLSWEKRQCKWAIHRHLNVCGVFSSKLQHVSYGTLLKLTISACVAKVCVNYDDLAKFDGHVSLTRHWWYFIWSRFRFVISFRLFN